MRERGVPQLRDIVLDYIQEGILCPMALNLARIMSRQLRGVLHSHPTGILFQPCAEQVLPSLIRLFKAFNFGLQFG